MMILRRRPVLLGVGLLVLVYLALVAATYFSCHQLADLACSDGVAATVVRWSLRCQLTCA